MENQTRFDNQTNSPKPNQSPMNPPVQAPSVKPGNPPPGDRDTKPKEGSPKIDNPKEHDKKSASAENIQSTHVMTKEANDQTTSPSTLELWKTKLNKAKQHWSKLQQDELIATEGSSELLSGLVQKRYSMNKAQADKQVEEFLADETR